MASSSGFSLLAEEADESLRLRKQLLINHLKLLPFHSSQSVVNYLRILYSTKDDLYFIDSSNVFPEFDQPDNYRKALFRGRELLRSLTEQETADLVSPTTSVSALTTEIDGLVDTYCSRVAHFVSTVPVPLLEEKTDTDVAIQKCHKAQSQLGCGGLFASAALEKGEVIVSIGEEYIINVLTAIRDDRFGQLAKRLLIDGHHVDTILLLFLIDLRNRTAAKLGPLPILWTHFFSNLPQSDFHTLLTWPEEAVIALGVSAVTAEVQNHKDMLIQAYTALPEDVVGNFSLEDLVWAKCLCSSRSFMNGNVPARTEFESEIVNRVPSRRLTCVVPGLDLLNHSPYAQCRVPVFNKDTAALEIKIETAVAEKQEIFLNYGGITNWEFLFHQGFCFSNNPNDKIEIELEPDTPEQQRIFSELHIPTTHILRRGAPHISPKFFQAVEILTGDKDNTTLITDLLESMRPSVPLPESAWWLVDYKDRIVGFRATYHELIDTLVHHVKSHYSQMLVQKKKTLLLLNKRRK